MAIPKKIHYCWFGNKPKGKLIEECIGSWKMILDNYEIIEWNEKNYSSESYFFNKCISKNKFAFASDYARFDILSKYGGIYLDTDMLFIKSLDELLSDHCFFGYENKENFISCGVIGAVANDPFITAIKKELDIVNSEFIFTGYTIVQLVSTVYNKMKITNEQFLPKVYPVDYFYPYPYAASGDPMSYVTPHTIAVHMWNASWLSDYGRAELLLKQGRKQEARKLYLKYLLQNPLYIRYLNKFFA